MNKITLSTLWQYSAILSMQGNELTELEFQSYQVQTHPLPPYQVQEPAPLNNELGSLAAAAATTRANLNMNLTNTQYGLIPSLSSSNYLAERPGAAGSLQETDLLRHYRYNISPGIDIGNPESPFGIKIMLAAREHKPVFASILALAAHHKYLIFLQQTNHDIDDSLEYRQKAEECLTFGSTRTPSEWVSLWDECQKWYTERPVELQQIVEIRGVEVDSIDAQNVSSFPILIFTTPLALAANAFYHMASFLLLKHRPRLLKVVPGPRSFTSHIWHAQSIVGISLSNDAPEQWDPILVAGLILVAKELTHESQQSAVLERITRITSVTGLKLDLEIETLKSGWSIAGHNEGLLT
ncbi:hypothetical protein D0Z07_1205 [Hyphodiscus hymeniophilus]|uniref:Uncharacterized protein n=1 Tax=Hyphodiscus hymeniophilus TaxID=353542 RepID=A0A9P7B0L5_9HELO|nr:hypothetical protein D0Z07_1205 [Hyphodiscus hymeniophilus]